MVLRICFAALLAAILVATSVPTLVQSTSPAYAAAKEKEKSATKEKAKKPPSEKQIAARQRMKDCGAEWQGLKKSKKTAGKSYTAFSKECLSRKK